MIDPLAVGVTSNSNHARPGSFISAASLSRRPSLNGLHSPEIDRISDLQVHGVAVPAGRRHRQADQATPAVSITSCRSTSRTGRRSRATGAKAVSAGTATSAVRNQRFGSQIARHPRSEQAPPKTVHQTSVSRPRLCPRGPRPVGSLRKRAGRNGVLVEAVGVTDDGRVPEPFDQLPAHASVDWRDQRQPQARQVRGQHRHKDQPAAAGPAAGRIPA